MPDRHVITLARHIIDQERQNPQATGAFTNIISALALAAKVISREVNKAGLVDILGLTGETNVQGERVRKLDTFAHEVIYNSMDHLGHLSCMVSEESEELIPIPDEFPTGQYVLLFDPLDGSSNIDVNVSIGTIFALHRKVSPGEGGTMEDCLQAGCRQVASGYVLYGSSTMLVYTTGAGVYGFTLDPSIGEFILSHPKIRIPEDSRRVYSVNEAYSARWSEAQRSLVDRMKGADGVNPASFSSRYIGSLVADFHRTLLKGGIFMYPGDSKSPNGKLRLLYEAAPLAFLCEQAGGRASNGTQDILTVEPTSLHQRTPLFIGTSAFVRVAEEHLTSYNAGGSEN